MPYPHHSRRTVLAAAVAALIAPSGRRAIGAAGAEVRVAGLFPDGPAGTAARRGATLAADEAARSRELLGGRFHLSTYAYEASALEDVGRRALAADRPQALLGAFSADECGALARLAAARGVLLMNVGCSDDDARAATCGPLVVHVAPGDAMRVAALVAALGGDEPGRRWWVIASDGASGQRAHDALRAAGAVPLGVGIATDAPDDVAARALAPGTHAILVTGLDAATRPVVARVAARAGAPPLAALGADPEPGVRFQAVGWTDRHERFGAEQLHARFRALHGAAMDEPAWSAWFATKLVGEAALRTPSADPAAFAAQMTSPRARFDGHKGTRLGVRPDDRQLRQPLYVLERDGARTALRTQVAVPAGPSVAYAACGGTPGTGT